MNSMSCTKLISGACRTKPRRGAREEKQSRWSVERPRQTHAHTDTLGEEAGKTVYEVVMSAELQRTEFVGVDHLRDDFRKTCAFDLSISVSEHVVLVVRLREVQRRTKRVGIEEGVSC